MRPVDYGTRPCEHCGTEFTIRDAMKNRTQRFCSKACYWQAKTVTQPVMSCAECGAEFTPRDKTEGQTRRFCRPSCARKADWKANPDRLGPMTGKTQSDEARRKIAAASMRRWATTPRAPTEERICVTCGKPFLMTNGSKPDRRFCGKSCAAKAQGRGGEHHNWKGGRSLNVHGYVTVRIDGKRRLEHQVVMEGLLGRALRPGENVHHINGDRADNTVDGPLVNFRSGNLELWSEAQPSGQRVADKVSYAEAILALYKPGVLRG